MNITQYEILMTPHRKIVLTWFETNWWHQNITLKVAKKTCGCYGLLGRAVLEDTHFKHLSQSEDAVQETWLLGDATCISSIFL